ncbi:MAG: SDR family NAD-dependent epimerase/dehydratase, partial [Deltaproteobacteria bacterium]|nr:SDR family NAD-dependent epimerase/dehydratase [Deltaproteobacteria bacterium]
QLARAVLEITGSNSKIVQKALPEDDPVRRCPDISLAKDKLNWEPFIPLQEGLQKTIEYFRKIL